MIAQANALEEMISYLFLNLEERKIFMDNRKKGSYEEFLQKKVIISSPVGIDIPSGKIHQFLYDFQADITRWALKKGRAAVFLETGQGKTYIQLEFTKQIGGTALIFAPLTVGKQTIRLAKNVDVEVVPVRSKDEIQKGKINITNYEIIKHFIGVNIDCVVAEESSIIKSIEGKTKKILFDHFTHIPYRLCCTATPCPNDIAEIANHSQFLGIMSREEMLSSFFVHDQDGWRLRGHARNPFHRWLSSWAIAMKNPYDLGYDGSRFVLPPLNIIDVIVKADGFVTEGLFPGNLKGIQDRIIVRRNTHRKRAEKAAEIANSTKDQVIIWTGINEESELITRLIPDAIEVKGPDSMEFKEQAIWDFIEGKHRVLVTKVKIAGMGMNFQNASTMIFLGLGDSQEAYYQAIRREWRYGQKNTVNVYVVVSDYETEIVENVRRKERESQEMVNELINESKDFSARELQKNQERVEVFERNSFYGNGWALYQGDCVEEIKRIPDNTVDLSVYSPPFLALYQYSATERDMGNSKNEGQFFEHFGFLIDDLLRVTKEGRVTCCHVSQVPAMLVRDGYIGLKDFRGRCVVEFEKRGWIYHGEIVIQKNPQVQAARVHAKGLLFAQLKKDSSWLRPGLADYILVFRKPGENQVPVLPDITNDQWISWAHPVWFDIRETNTLNVLEARSEKDDRHICLASGTLVLTHRSGYIPIEEVQIGDLVLTHRGRWMPVMGKRSNGVRRIIRVCAQGVADLRVTPDHQIWVRSCIGKGRWPGTNRGINHHKFAAQRNDPEWMVAESILGSYVNLKLPPIVDSPLTKEEWWIVGRWLGDGHRGGHRRSGRRGGLGQFFISCAHNEVPYLINKLEQHVGHIAVLTASQIALRDLRYEVRNVLSRCGNGAANKRLPSEAFLLPPEKAEALLLGYLSADGHYNKLYDRWSASSISRSLLLGMSMIAQRARGSVVSVYAGRSPRQGKICNRIVNMSQDWMFCFRDSVGYRQSGWISADGAWKKVRKIDEAGQAEVWDLSVAEDESFTAEGAIVKNCPLQLDVIERCVRLWSNPGETVLSPFAGIGSEGYISLRHKRKFIGIELKPLYVEVAAKNLKAAEQEEQKEMFV